MSTTSAGQDAVLASGSERSPRGLSDSASTTRPVSVARVISVGRSSGRMSAGRVLAIVLRVCDGRREQMRGRPNSNSDVTALRLPGPEVHDRLGFFPVYPSMIAKLGCFYDTMGLDRKSRAWVAASQCWAIVARPQSTWRRPSQGSGGTGKVL
jgi:hypothetical protein